MSRTRRGSKAPGHEYWSRRPGSQSTPGPESKRRTHRSERMQAKQVVAQELDATLDTSLEDDDWYLFDVYYDDD